MEKKKNNFANLFGNNPNISLEERDRVVAAIEQIGGLTFKVSKHEAGWTAQCNEVSSILAGSTNPRPTIQEIEMEIRDAIFAAFNVRTNTRIEARGAFEYSFA